MNMGYMKILETPFLLQCSNSATAVGKAAWTREILTQKIISLCPYFFLTVFFIHMQTFISLSLLWGEKTSTKSFWESWWYCCYTFSYC